MAKRTVYEVRWHKGWGTWAIYEDSHEISNWQRKPFAVDHARRYARANQPSILRVKGKNGRIQFEATYGRDPRRHKG